MGWFRSKLNVHGAPSGGPNGTVTGEFSSEGTTESTTENKRKSPFGFLRGSTVRDKEHDTMKATDVQPQQQSRSGNEEGRKMTPVMDTPSTASKEKKKKKKKKNKKVLERFEDGSGGLENVPKQEMMNVDDRKQNKMRNCSPDTSTGGTNSAERIRYGTKMKTSKRSENKGALTGDTSTRSQISVSEGSSSQYRTLHDQYQADDEALAGLYNASVARNNNQMDQSSPLAGYETRSQVSFGPSLSLGRGRISNQELNAAFALANSKFAESQANELARAYQAAYEAQISLVIECSKHTASYDNILRDLKLWTIDLAAATDDIAAALDDVARRRDSISARLANAMDSKDERRVRKLAWIAEKLPEAELRLRDLGQRLVPVGFAVAALEDLREAVIHGSPEVDEIEKKRDAIIEKLFNDMNDAGISLPSLPSARKSNGKSNALQNIASEVRSLVADLIDDAQKLPKQPREESASSNQEISVISSDWTMEEEMEVSLDDGEDTSSKLPLLRIPENNETPNGLTTNKDEHLEIESLSGKSDAQIINKIIEKKPADSGEGSIAVSENEIGPSGLSEIGRLKGENMRKDLENGPQFENNGTTESNLQIEDCLQDEMEGNAGESSGGKCGLSSDNTKSISDSFLSPKENESAKICDKKITLSPTNSSKASSLHSCHSSISNLDILNHEIGDISIDQESLQATVQDISESSVSLPDQDQSSERSDSDDKKVFKEGWSLSSTEKRNPFLSLLKGSSVSQKVPHYMSPIGKISGRIKSNSPSVLATRRVPGIVTLYNEIINDRGIVSEAVGWKREPMLKTHTSLPCLDESCPSGNISEKINFFSPSNPIDIVYFVKAHQGLPDAVCTVKRSASKWTTMRAWAKVYDSLSSAKVFLSTWRLSNDLSFQEECYRLVDYFSVLSYQVSTVSNQHNNLRIAIEKYNLLWEENMLDEVRLAAQDVAVEVMKMALTSAEKSSKLRKHRANILRCLGHATIVAFNVHQFSGGFIGDNLTICEELLQQTLHYARDIDPKWFRGHKVVT